MEAYWRVCAVLGRSWAVLGRLGGDSKKSWAVLGRRRGALGDSWGPYWGRWGRLGASWRPLSASWGRVGASWAAWAPLEGRLGGRLTDQKSVVWGGLGRTLRPGPEERGGAGGTESVRILPGIKHRLCRLVGHIGVLLFCIVFSMPFWIDV